MAKGRRWSRDELIVAMHLYCRLSFGQLHGRNPEIISVAGALERTPGSVAMKLCNLASLDTAVRASGRKGLEGASRGDQEVWDSFESDWRGMLMTAEALSSRMGIARPFAGPFEDLVHEGKEPRETERVGRAVVRVGQEFFRTMVLTSYDHRCCITGNSVPDC